MATKQSKMDKARAIYASNKKATPAELTKLFMQRLKMTAFGARTYSYNVRNEKPAAKAKAKAPARKRAPKKAPDEQAAA